MSRAVAVFCLLTLVMSAQPVSAEEPIQLKKFRVLLTTGERLEGHHGVLDENELRGVSSNDTALVISRTDIRALDRHLGSRASQGALMGGGMGLLSAVLGVMQAEADAASDPYIEVDDSRIMPVMVGFTAGGALIGLAVGSASQRWEKIPMHVSFGYSANDGEIRMLLQFPF